MPKVVGIKDIKENKNKIEEILKELDGTIIEMDLTESIQLNVYLEYTKKLVASYQYYFNDMPSSGTIYYSNKEIDDNIESITKDEIIKYIKSDIQDFESEDIREMGKQRRTGIWSFLNGLKR